MTLVKSTIKAAIVDLVNNNPVEDAETSTDYFADGLSDIIINAIKSGTITVAAGIGVQVTPATGTGATITQGSGVIS